VDIFQKEFWIYPAMSKKVHRLIIFTESYVFGGDQQYIGDFAKVGLELFDEIYYVGNPEAFKNEKTEKLFSETKFYPVSFVSRSRLRWKLRKFSKILRAGPLLLASLCLPVFFIVNFFILRAVLKKTKPDVIYAANGGYPASFVVSQMAWLGKIRGCRCVYSIVNTPTPRPRWKQGFGRWIDQKIWGSVEFIIVNGKVIREKLLNLYQAPDSKIKVITNGVENKKLDRPACSDLITIGSFSRLSPEKGIGDLISAFINLADKYPNLKLKIPGVGEELENLQGMVKSAGLSDRVEFLGFYAGDSHVFLQTLDIFALPSLYEGLPYALLEAMRAGCAIVATPVGAVKEVVSHGDSALFVQPENIPELTEALELLIQNTELRENLGKRARVLFEQEHTKERMAACIKEVLIATIGKS